jgi:hypothetical protein
MKQVLDDGPAELAGGPGNDDHDDLQLVQLR